MIKLRTTRSDALKRLSTIGSAQDSEESNNAQFIQLWDSCANFAEPLEINSGHDGRTPFIEHAMVMLPDF